MKQSAGAWRRTGRLGRPLRALPRRVLLRGAGGLTLGLPFLEAMTMTGRGPKARAATEAPQRFIAFFSPNGTVHSEWEPEGNETDFSFGPILQPLNGFKKDLVVVSGLDQNGTGGDGHQNGMGVVLTGRELNPGPFRNAFGGTAGWANGISVDQEIAKHVGVTTRFRSLELGVQVFARDNYGRMCYLGPDQPLPPDDDPHSVFNRLFASEAGATQVAETSALRKSILDGVSASFGPFLDKLGAADRQRVQRHLETVRDLEMRLQASAVETASCQTPAAPAARSGGVRLAEYAKEGQAMMELLAMAMACDLTRVATLQWSESTGEHRFVDLGATIGHHSLSHMLKSEATSQLTLINAWYAERFAELLGHLAAIEDVDGKTVLENSVVAWCNELGNGATHSRQKAPWVLAGQAGGALRTGRFLVRKNVPHNNLLVSFLNIMGLPVQRFGRPDWCTGPLEGLV